MEKDNALNQELDSQNQTETETNSTIATDNEANPIDNELTVIKAELASAKDAMLRAHAENDNFRRRAAKELEEAQKFSITKFAREMLEVLENLHRAISNMPANIESYDDHVKNFFQGIQMTLTGLESAFEKNGIVRIYPLEQKFDHNYHQAIGHLENQDKEPNTIVQVIRAGYMIKDRLLQPALVMLSKK